LTLPAEAAPWLDQWLGRGWTSQPLAGDASFRAYYRITAADGRTFMLAWYPEEVRSHLVRYLGATEAIAPHVRVPEVLQHCDAAVLQQDAGDRTLYAVLHQDREEGLRLYRAAVDLLAAFQKAPDRGLTVPFSAKVFWNEMEMTREYFVEKLMEYDAEPLKPFLVTISQNVAQHPYVLCHRDFHGQNLHVQNGTLYLIDYQDMRRGPDLYDLASLLRDRGVARIIGDEAELDLLQHYAEVAGAAGNVRHRYFEVLLQRSIKILGTFAKQPIARGRMHYLDFIPGALESVSRCIDELPGYAALRDIFPLQFDLHAARDRAQKLNEAAS
jgi:aminoglycoside/choline kinase family phosphotransferase